MMSQDNQITLRGFVTAEPRFWQKTPEAVPLAEIRVGSTPRRLNRETGEWQDLPTSYYTVKVWRRLAINAASSLHKGDMVVIRGRFYMNTWVDNQQQPRARLEIEADSLGHDLSYGWSHFLRGARPQAQTGAGIDAGEAARQDLESARDDDGEYSADGDWDELSAVETTTEGASDLAEPGTAEIPVGVGLPAGVGQSEGAAVPFAAERVPF
jgi:single-strand DNA-binding protein